MSMIIFGLSLIVIALWVKANIRSDAPPHICSEADLVMLIGAVAVAVSVTEAIFKR